MASHELAVEPEVSGIPRLIDWVEGCCGQEGVAADVTFKMTLAIEEAVMNVIGHAFAGRAPPHEMRLRLDITAESVIAELIDNGDAFDPTAAPEPDLSLPLDERRIGGLGIHLMRHMMDQLHYSRSDGNNYLRLEKTRR